MAETTTAKRSPKGSGSPARWREDLKRWEARYTLDGRRRSVYGLTQGEAERSRRAALSAKDAGLPIVPERFTVKDCMTGWLASSRVRKRKPNTIKQYESATRTHVIPRLGQLRLKDLQPRHIESALDGMTADGKAPATLALVRVILVCAIAWAERNGYASRNVARLVKGPSRPKTTGPITTADEAHALLAAVADHRLAPLFRFLVGTGRRVGEALALKWADVDFEGGTYTVTGTLQHEGGQRVVRATKTQSSAGQYALSKMAAEALKVQRATQRRERLAAGAGWQNTGYVFTAPDGGLQSRHTPLVVLQRRLARAKLPPVTVHDLRHAAATLARSEGADLADIQQLLGHASINTTGRYAHGTEKRGRDTAAKLDAAMGTSAG